MEKKLDEEPEPAHFVRFDNDSIAPCIIHSDDLRIGICDDSKAIGYEERLVYQHEEIQSKFLEK